MLLSGLTKPGERDAAACFNLPALPPLSPQRSSGGLSCFVNRTHFRYLWDPSGKEGLPSCLPACLPACLSYHLAGRDA